MFLPFPPSSLEPQSDLLHSSIYRAAGSDVTRRPLPSPQTHLLGNPSISTGMKGAKHAPSATSFTELCHSYPKSGPLETAFLSFTEFGVPKTRTCRKWFLMFLVSNYVSPQGGLLQEAREKWFIVFSSEPQNSSLWGIKDSVLDISLSRNRCLPHRAYLDIRAALSYWRPRGGEQSPWLYHHLSGWCISSAGLEAVHGHNHRRAWLGAATLLSDFR